MSDKTKNKNNELSNNLSEYSNDFVELYKKQPLWIVRWGIFFTAIAIILLLVFSYYIKYPETINTSIAITSTRHSESMMAVKNGQISEILIKDGDLAHKNEAILVLKTDVNYKDVLWLSKELEAKSNDPQLLKQNLEKKHPNVGYIIQIKLEDFFKLVNNKASIDKTEESLTNLRLVINEWIQKNIIISPFDGKVNFLTLLYNGKNVKDGEELIKISSVDKVEPTGSILVSAREISKVIKNQKVLIKLDNYSYDKYGIIEGLINKISSSPNKEGYYYISISLPKQLITSSKKEIPVDRDLVGSAEIIISNKSILTRFIQQITSKLNN